MTEQTLFISLNALMWAYLAYRFARAARSKRITRGESLIGWGVFFTLYLSVLLTVDALETAIDAAFGGLPIALAMRTLSMFTAVVLVHVGMRKLHDEWQTLKRALLLFTGLGLSGLAVFFVWSAATRAVSAAEISLVVRVVRDVVLIGWLMILLIPPAITMYMREITRPPRFRAIIILLAYTALLLQFFSELASLTALIHGSETAAGFLRMERVSSYSAYLLFFAMLIPYNVLLPLFYPRLMYTYVRMRRLSKRVAPNAYVYEKMVEMTQPEDLEVAIYSHVIAVLDHYQRLPENSPLRAQIQGIIDKNWYGDHHDLARGLIKVRL